MNIIKKLLILNISGNFYTTYKDKEHFFFYENELYYGRKLIENSSNYKNEDNKIKVDFIFLIFLCFYYEGHEPIIKRNLKKNNYYSAGRFSSELMFNIISYLDFESWDRIFRYCKYKINVFAEIKSSNTESHIIKSYPFINRVLRANNLSFNSSLEKILKKYNIDSLLLSPITKNTIIKNEFAIKTKSNNIILLNIELLKKLTNINTIIFKDLDKLCKKNFKIINFHEKNEDYYDLKNFLECFEKNKDVLSMKKYIFILSQKNEENKYDFKQDLFIIKLITKYLLDIIKNKLVEIEITINNSFLEEDIYELYYQLSKALKGADISDFLKNNYFSNKEFSIENTKILKNIKPLPSCNISEEEKETMEKNIFDEFQINHMYMDVIVNPSLKKIREVGNYKFNTISLIYPETSITYKLCC